MGFIAGWRRRKDYFAGIWVKRKYSEGSIEQITRMKSQRHTEHDDKVESQKERWGMQPKDRMKR